MNDFKELAFLLEKIGATEIRADEDAIDFRIAACTVAIRAEGGLGYDAGLGSLRVSVEQDSAGTEKTG